MSGAGGDESYKNKERDKPMMSMTVNFPDPIDVGFVEGELAELLRLIIRCSALYWEEDDDDVEMSHVHVCSAQSSILRYVDKHNLSIGMPGYAQRFERAVRFIELENDDTADVDEYQNFGLVDSLPGLCDEVSLWCDSNGYAGFDHIAINLINFCLSATWFESQRNFEFQGDSADVFLKLLDEVTRCHNQVAQLKQSIQ